MLPIPDGGRSIVLDAVQERSRATPSSESFFRRQGAVSAVLDFQWRESRLDITQGSDGQGKPQECGVQSGLGEHHQRGYARDHDDQGIKSEGRGAVHADEGAAVRTAGCRKQYVPHWDRSCATVRAFPDHGRHRPRIGYTTRVSRAPASRATESLSSVASVVFPRDGVSDRLQGRSYRPPRCLNITKAST